MTNLEKQLEEAWEAIEWNVKKSISNGDKNIYWQISFYDQGKIVSCIYDNGERRLETKEFTDKMQLYNAYSGEILEVKNGEVVGTGIYK